MNNPALKPENRERVIAGYIEKVSYSKKSSEWMNTWFREFLTLVQSGEQQRYANSLNLKVISYTHLRRNLPIWIQLMSVKFPEDERYANLLFRYNLAHV